LFAASLVALAIIALMANEKNEGRRRSTLRLMVEDARLNGTVRSTSVILWLKSTFTIAIFFIVGYVAMALWAHPFDYTSEIQPIEIVWMIPLPFFALYKVFERPPTHQIVVLNPDKIDIITIGNNIPAEHKTMKLIDVKIDAKIGEGVDITLTDGNNELYLYRRYSNYPWLCDYLLKTASDKFVNNAHFLEHLRGESLPVKKKQQSMP
jgi:hypothetical protein